MTIYESSRSMTSSVTPDIWAWRPSRCAAEPAWRLSWEPGSVCTREEALAALRARELRYPAAAWDRRIRPLLCRRTRVRQRPSTDIPSEPPGRELENPETA
ncbi:hypothetical protein ACFVMC_13215 [Nocardia sp. NPDC127579]|uniref:hypothetical protein n=1 Tax=Nocardia sp. NPDC127579 TaxID=3345402 RepID=UPI00362D12F3